MRRDIYIEINGRAADISPDTDITLNFNSPLLGDITDIKGSVTQTISLPRTANNDAIFDLALQPQYNSGVRNKRLPCLCRLNGVTIFDDGMCSLLSSPGDAYEVAISFGFLKEFEEWKSSGKKLTDLHIYKDDVIAWNEFSGSTIMSGGVTQVENAVGASLFYYNYDCGVESRKIINIHPCVKLHEIWERIRLENDLKLKIGSEFNYMRRLAIVLENNNISLQTISDVRDMASEIPYIQRYTDDIKTINLDIDAQWWDNNTSTLLQTGYSAVRLSIPSIEIMMIEALTDPQSPSYQSSAVNFFTEYNRDPTLCRLVVKTMNDGRWRLSYLTGTRSGYKIIFESLDLDFENYTGEEYQGEPLAQIYIELRRWGSVPADVWDNPNSGLATYSWTYPLREAFVLNEASFVVEYTNNSNDYPLNEFALVPNLPDINQVDFVKFICHYYGLMPVRRGQSIDFIRIDVLADNIDNGSIEDWSEKLLLTYDDAPQVLEPELEGYAQNNIIRYMLDENDPIVNMASMNVDNDMLEMERVMIELPFAATKGDRIPQYYLDDENNLNSNDLEYRLMAIVGSNLEFTESMDARQILNRNYSFWKNIINSPIVIEEEIMLNELDLQGLDYTKPVYLSKYGRFYAVISVQWTSNELTSKVKLLQIR